MVRPCFQRIGPCLASGKKKKKCVSYATLWKYFLHGVLCWSLKTTFCDRIVSVVMNALDASRCWSAAMAFWECVLLTSGAGKAPVVTHFVICCSFADMWNFNCSIVCVILCLLWKKKKKIFSSLCREKLIPKYSFSCVWVCVCVAV